MDLKDILKMVCIIAVTVFIIKLLVDVLIGIILFAVIAIVVVVGLYISWRILQKYF